MIQEIILKDLSKRIIDAVLKGIKNTKVKSYTKESDLFVSLNQHMIFVNQWSSEVNFSDLKQAKSIERIFVQLDLYVQPLRQRLSENEKIEKIELSKLFSKNNNHIALLGQVGSGKTTSLKYLCQSLLFNNGFFPNNLCFPIVIKLNEFNSLSRENEFNKNIIFDAIIKILGIKFDFQNIEEKAIENIKEAVIIQFLNQKNILLLLDGFDELIFQNRREVVIHEFEKLIANVTLSRIVLTSRSSDFKYSFDNLSIYEICPLNEDQIFDFANRWLEDSSLAEDFINKIKKGPIYDTAIRPLTIAHLCAIYERYNNIPEKPKTIYKKIVLLLLEEWNAQRNIHRTSKYSKFDTDIKFEFLSSLAYNLTIANSTNSFDNSLLRVVYQKIYQDFDLEITEMISVINELESHNGLILQSGFQKFEFAHKSIQEYLTAEYIVKLPTIPVSRSVILKMPNEFAVAIAISSKPSEYFVEFVNNRIIKNKYGTQFIKPFINRLLLEKVDFNKQQNVAYSALLLYSIYIQAIKEEDIQLSFFYFDDLIYEFENFINEIFKRNDKIEFFNNYSIVNEYPTVDGQLIYMLELKTKVKQNFPKVLFSRESFLI